MAAANDLRPVQARGNLELMMKRQLELRREETKALHTKCDALESKLVALRVAAQGVVNLGLKHESDTDRSSSAMQGIIEVAPDKIPNASTVVLEDVLRWAEEIS